MKYYFCVFILFSCETGLSQYVGNPDDAAKIERPCPTYDLNCIRKYFSENANCNKVFGPAPDLIIRPHLSYAFPRVNMSVTILNANVIGINGMVEEFFINKVTDRLVFTVNFRLNLSSDQAFFKFHRTAKEPIVTTAPAAVYYESVAITAIIPDLDDLKLEEAECTAFTSDAYPPTFVGPTAAESTDPQVQVAVVEFAAGLPVNSQELFLTDAFYYFNAFIQYNICDFGLILT